MSRVVVTGIGAVTPVGNSVPDFWDSIAAGRHGIAPITKFDATDFKVKIAAEVKDFDPLVRIPKSEARHMDLYAQFALSAAAEAVEDSGIIGKVSPDKLGVYVGSGIGGMSTFISETEKLLTAGPRRVSPFFIPMMISNIAAGQISIKYGATGPSLPIVTACATSTNTIGEAFRAIKHGYAHAIIAGGAEASINPLAVAGFTNCMALSTRNLPDESSIPFDRRRDGFVIGEGAGILILEEYDHALRRGAKMYAEICGYGNTSDAYHITAPHPEAIGSTEMIKLAFSEARIPPDEHLYINPHGTSTQLNDKTETLAIKLALGNLAYKIPISSTKSMTGHMFGAAGGVEAIAAIKTIETGIIPPTIGYLEADPECDLDYVPNKMRASKVDTALSISLGFGGHNAGVLFNRI